MFTPAARISIVTDQSLTSTSSRPGPWRIRVDQVMMTMIMMMIIMMIMMMMISMSATAPSWRRRAVFSTSLAGGNILQKMK